MLRIFFTWAIDVVPALIFTFLIAALSYRYFETPFLKMKKRHAIIESQPILGDEQASPSEIRAEV
jgi:peptidoglycan/LPS O-acetylase OafA/YrhL